MASESSFDIVSDYDERELQNAIENADREIRNRFDLKGTGSEILLEKDQIILKAPDDYKIRALFDILESKAIKRGLSTKIFDPQEKEDASLGSLRQVVLLRRGLSSEQAKDLNKYIRTEFKKAKTQIQGESVRVTSKSRDELQQIISFLKALEFDAPLQFENYR